MLSAAVNRTGFIFLVASGIIMAAMGLLVSYGVARRYLFASPEPYSYEYTTYLLLACMLLPAAHATAVGRHIKADLLLNRLPKRVQSVLQGLLSPAVGFLFCAILTWKSWGVAWRSLQIGKVNALSGVPIFAVQVVVPIASALVCLVLLSQIAGYLASVSDNTGKSSSPT